jgi:hypothetical protein
MRIADCGDKMPEIRSPQSKMEKSRAEQRETSRIPFDLSFWFRFLKIDETAV